MSQPSDERSTSSTSRISGQFAHVCRHLSAPERVKGRFQGLTMSFSMQTIDKSIHSAYVTAIRRAQHFIYIENQYFMGSSHCWPGNRSAPCRHLIPLEIALKIVAKINRGERFAAYIVLPMYSEGEGYRHGVPDCASTCFSVHCVDAKRCMHPASLLPGQMTCFWSIPRLLTRPAGLP